MNLHSIQSAITMTLTNLPGNSTTSLGSILRICKLEDAIRNAISIVEIVDTLAAITVSIAEAYYGVPTDIREKAESYLDTRSRV